MTKIRCSRCGIEGYIEESAQWNIDPDNDVCICPKCDELAEAIEDSEEFTDQGGKLS